MSRQIQLPLETVAELLDAATALVSISTDSTLNAKANKAIASISSLMRQTAGPGIFSGSEFGEYRVDPTQSPFL